MCKEKILHIPSVFNFRLKIQFFSCTSCISSAQQPHVASGYHIRQLWARLWRTRQRKLYSIDSIIASSLFCFPFLHPSPTPTFLPTWLRSNGTKSNYRGRGATNSTEKEMGDKLSLETCVRTFCSFLPTSSGRQLEASSASFSQCLRAVLQSRWKKTK